MDNLTPVWLGKKEKYILVFVSHMWPRCRETREDRTPLSVGSFHISQNQREESDVQLAIIKPREVILGDTTCPVCGGSEQSPGYSSELKTSWLV